MLPALGEPLHTRQLGVVLSGAEGGRVRAAARLIDLRKCGFVPLGGDLQTAGVIHDMQLSALLDPRTRVLESLEAAQPAVAFEAAPETGGESCRDPIHGIQALVGLSLGAFAQALGRELGGPRGCSRVLTLARLLATALPRALDLEQAAGYGAERRPGERAFLRSLSVDCFEAGAGAVQLAVHLADFHLAPSRRVARPMDRFARQSELRVFCRVDLAALALEEVRAWERDRTREQLGDASWAERSGEVAALRGRSVMSGLAAEVLRRFAERPGDALLAEALLHVAPGFLQSVAALSERWIAGAGRGPGSPAVGGMPDSCYMWRKGGALLQIRGAAPGETAPRDLASGRPGDG